MNDLNKTGGPAFPQHSFEPNPNGGEPRIIWQEGMTLRDYFAAKALACWSLGHCTEAYHKHAARQAYAIADAMLEERVK